MKKTKSIVKPRDPASFLKTAGALRTIAFSNKADKKGRKAKHKKALWA